jgi:predicted PurR-regulated permease PerM
VPEKTEALPPRRQRPAQTALIVLAVLAVIASAKIAAPFLIPVIVGMLTSYALKPLVATLERVHIHRAIGSAVVLAVLTGLIAGGVFLLRDDATSALAELPNAARKIRMAARENARQPHGRWATSGQRPRSSTAPPSRRRPAASPSPPPRRRPSRRNCSDG